MTTPLPGGRPEFLFNQDPKGKADRAGAFAAERVEQRKIIAFRNADRPSDLVPLVLLREKPGKVRPPVRTAPTET